MEKLVEGDENSINRNNKENITINKSDKEISNKEKNNQIKNINNSSSSLNEIKTNPELYINNDENIFLEEKTISSQEDYLYEYENNNKFCECFFFGFFYNR